MTKPLPPKKDGKVKVGRPTVMTQETIAKLEQAYAVGATDIEACFFAGISKQTLYDYQHIHPEFIDRKEALKESLKIRAKLNLANSLNAGDTNDSKWYLERRSKDEFSVRQITQLQGDSDNPVRMDVTLDNKTKAEILDSIDAKYGSVSECPDKVQV